MMALIDFIMVSPFTSAHSATPAVASHAISGERKQQPAEAHRAVALVAVGLEHGDPVLEFLHSGRQPGRADATRSVRLVELR